MPKARSDYLKKTIHCIRTLPCITYNAVFVDVDDFCQTFLPAREETPNFFRCQTKKQTFSPLH
uniref:hypothetical protein n=1 Tax=Candidatus Enterovibrio escicola TaxID=1927127 RepID=UPI001238271F|nr:hypothetical protein [Candidatus Enterovibrio escacola]